MTDKKKIEKLTPEQEAMLPKYVEEGIRIGMDTNDEYDLELVKKLITDQVTMCGKVVPKEFITTYDSPMAVIEAFPEATYGNTFYGLHDINWVQYLMFFRNECGLVEETKEIVNFYELAKQVGWFWLCEEHAIITRKPSTLNMVEKQSNDGPIKVLHSETEMALSYRDGRGIYALDGIVLPKDQHWLITEPEKRSAESILKIENVDIRNAALKLLGSEGLLSAVDHTVIHQDSIEVPHMPMEEIATKSAADFQSEFSLVKSHYQLVEFELNNQRRVYLRGECPSKGEKFTEAVPPDCKTVQQALSWREEGVISDEYVLPLVRT